MQTVERYGRWIVSVPDDMDTERIKELMLEMVDNGDLELDQEELDDTGEPIVECCDDDFDPEDAHPELMLTDRGLVDEDAILKALTTDRLKAELERRQAKESGTIVV